MRFLILVALLVSFHAGACENQASRTARPSFKGVELYSWLDAPTKTWRFVLLPSTNREKSAEEVLRNPSATRSVQELESMLTRLAPSESVFWLAPEAGGFAFPPKAVIDGIKQNAAKCQVSVTVLSDA